MTSPSTPGFSDKELDGCHNWTLPDVSSNRLIPSAEKEARDKKKYQQRECKNNGPVDKSIGESVETVEENVAPITAEQLQSITESAEKEGYESGYQAGLEEGKQEGIKQGYAEGMEQSKKAIAEQCERLQHILDALLIPLQTEQQQLETLMLDIVCQLSEAVVLRELKTDSSHIIKLVENSLNTVPVNAEKFSLFLNSQDIDLVKEHLNSHPHYQSQYHSQNSDESFVFHVDDTLIPGGCRLESRQTVVDYTVEQRLQKVIDDFLHKRFVSHDDHASKNSDVQKDDDAINVHSGAEIQEGTERNIKIKTDPETETGKLEEKTIDQETIKEEIKTEEIQKQTKPLGDEDL